MNLLSAVRQHVVLALAPVVALIAVGVGLGIRRQPVYTARAEINVGVQQIPSSATAAYVEASQELASEYARQVGGLAIRQGVAKRTGLDVGSIDGRLSASVIPSSPTFYINATGSTPAAAARVSVAATAALKQLINTVQQGQGDSPQVLNRYRQLQRQADSLQQSRQNLQAQLPATDPTRDKQLLNANLAEQVADLQAQAVGNEYAGAATTMRGAIIDVLNPAQAATATSDRRPVTERYALVGALAGILLGAAFALLAQRATVGRRPVRDVRGGGHDSVG